MAVAATGEAAMAVVVAAQTAVATAVAVMAMVPAPERVVGKTAVMAAAHLRPVTTTAAAGVAGVALHLRLRVMTTAITAVPKAER
jgi:hypothetical protein